MVGAFVARIRELVKAQEIKKIVICVTSLEFLGNQLEINFSLFGGATLKSAHILSFGRNTLF